MFFDSAHPRAKLVDFFRHTIEIRIVLLDLVEAAVRVCEFAADGTEILCGLRAEKREVVFGDHVTSDVDDILFSRHVFDDVREHIAKLFECCFLRHEWIIIRVVMFAN